MELDVGVPHVPCIPYLRVCILFEVYVTQGQGLIDSKGGEGM